MTMYDGPDRTEPSDETVVSVSEQSHHGSFTVYLEPGETAEIACDEPNRVAFTVYADLEGGDGG